MAAPGRRKTKARSNLMIKAAPETLSNDEENRNRKVRARIFRFSWIKLVTGLVGVIVAVFATVGKPLAERAGDRIRDRVLPEAATSAPTDQVGFTVGVSYTVPNGQ